MAVRDGADKGVAMPMEMDPELKKAGLGLQGLSFAEQISQRPLDQYLLDRLPIAHFSKCLCIHQPPETQIIEKDDFLFFFHGQRSL